MQNQFRTEQVTSAIIPFSYENHEIRTIKDTYGAPWWIAKDVCDILGLKNVTKALSKIPEKHLTLLQFRAGGQIRDMNAVDEPGLYRLILRSNKPQAEPFMEWVTSEVLPQIRKTGKYQAPGSHPPLPSRYRQRRHEPPVPDGMKRCSACRQDMPRTDDFFGLDRTRSDGLNAYCYDCRKAYGRTSKTKQITHKPSITDKNALIEKILRQVKTEVEKALKNAL